MAVRWIILLFLVKGGFPLPDSPCNPCQCSTHDVNDTHLFISHAKVVDCSSRGLTSLPPSLPQDVDVLFLTDNNLETISLSQFPSLRALYMGNNNFTVVTNETFMNASSLELLDLTGNILDVVTSVETADLRALTTVRGLHTRRVTEDAFNNTRKLKELELRVDQSALPIGLFTSVSDLVTLKLTLSSVNAFPKGIIQPLRETLKMMYLHAPNIALLDAGLFEAVKTLEHIYLNLPSARTIPSDTFGLPADCQHVNDYQCSILNLIASLQKLREITLVGIDTLPFNLFDRSPNVKKLIIAEARNLHEDLFQKVKLEELGLSKNYLKEINAKHLRRSENLHTLNLSHNFLDEVKELDFADLTSLKKLDLSHNKVSSFHRNLTRDISSLEYLNLSHNEICSLGKDTFDLSLVELHLENNCLTMLNADTFRELGNLRFLNLSENHLEIIPVDTFSMTCALQWLDLTGNNFTYVPLNAIPHTTLYVSVADNPLHCDCHLAWLTLIDVAEMPTPWGRCAAPVEYAGQPLVSVLSTLPCVLHPTNESKSVDVAVTCGTDSANYTLVHQVAMTPGEVHDGRMTTTTPIIQKESFPRNSVDTLTSPKTPSKSSITQQPPTREMFRKEEIDQDVTDAVWFWVLLALIGLAIVIIVVIGVRLRHERKQRRDSVADEPADAPHNESKT